MLNSFDLYDLYAIFVNIRNNEYDVLNGDIVSKILDVLKNRTVNFETNQFRTALSTFDLSKQPEYSFVYTQNVYTYIPSLIKEEKVYELLEIVCEELLKIISQHKYEQVRDLADVLHNLPLMIVEQNLSIPVDFWCSEIKYYRKKWNNSFLNDYEKKYL